MTGRCSWCFFSHIKDCYYCWFSTYFQKYFGFKFSNIHHNNCLYKSPVVFLQFSLCTSSQKLSILKNLFFLLLCYYAYLIYSYNIFLTETWSVLQSYFPQSCNFTNLFYLSLPWSTVVGVSKVNNLIKSCYSCHNKLFQYSFIWKWLIQ